MHKSKGLRQACDVQDFAHSCITALRRATTDEQGNQRLLTKDETTSLGVLGKVWKDAQEQVRIHRGKPLPGSLTHEKVRSTRQRRTLQVMTGMLASYPEEADVAPQGDAAQPDNQPHVG